MKTTNNAIKLGEVITLHGPEWIEKQRVAGKVVANALLQLEEYCRNKTYHSMAALNEVIEKYIESQDCGCTFKGYKSFPAGVCISINKQLVHGIPDDTILQDGDIVSFDLGATTREGLAIADAAITLIFGQPRSNRHTELVQATEEALFRSIQAIRPGKRLGVIGEAIYKCGRSHNLSVVQNYGGHSISIDTPHAPPFICNRSTSNEGVRLATNMTLAIEPLFVLGSSNRTRVLDDGWTVVCDDVCSHHEQTIFIHEDHVEIMTWRGSETYLKSNKVYFNET